MLIVFLGNVIHSLALYHTGIRNKSFQEYSSSFPTSNHSGLHTEIFSSHSLNLGMFNLCSSDIQIFLDGKHQANWKMKYMKCSSFFKLEILPFPLLNNPRLCFGINSGWICIGIKIIIEVIIVNSWSDGTFFDCYVKTFQTAINLAGFKKKEKKEEERKTEFSG